MRTHNSLELRLKISKANRGENHYLYGKTRSEEVKRKISDKNKNKKHTYKKTDKFTYKIKTLYLQFDLEGNFMYSSYTIKELADKNKLPFSTIQNYIKSKMKKTKYYFMKEQILICEHKFGKKRVSKI